jgi:VanZ family protein
MYAGLTLTIWYDHVVKNKKAINWKHYLSGFLYASLLGGLMELAQAYLTTCRSGDWIDFEADAIGAAIGIGLSILANKLWAGKISGQN